MDFTRYFDKKEIIMNENTDKTPEEILRSANYKIKGVYYTKFGTQIDLFIMPDEAEINSLIGGKKIEIDGKSIFIRK